MLANRLPISNYALIAANLIPLIGVLFFQWNSVLVLALFWIENLIIGAFNVVRIISVGFIRKDISSLFTCAFFIVHYGLFCSVHGDLLMNLLNYPTVDYTRYFAPTTFPLFELFLEGGGVLMQFLEDLSPTIWLGVIALTLSRLVSFIENFLLRGDIFKVTVNKLMAQPYSQIVVMHVGLILGAVLLEKFDSPIWLLAVIVIMKIFVDFSQHQSRHKQNLKARIKDL